jgi:hypothetical protein
MNLAPFFMLFCSVLGASLQESPEQTAAQKVELYRLSDRVVTRDGSTGKENVMFYNNKLALLGQGDEVRQGSGARSECRMEDDGRVRFFGRARYRFGELSREHYTILVEEFSRMLVKARSNMTLLLPGGSRLTMSFNDCYLERVGNLLHIRNFGASDIKLAGHLVPEEDRILPGGHKISIPLFDPDLEEEREPVVVREVAGMIVKTTGGYRFEEKPGIIVVSRPLGMEDGIACIGGTRVFLEPGETIIFRVR